MMDQQLDDSKSYHHYSEHQVVKSINLTYTPHSAFKFSNSKPLTDDSFNNLSLSSENSAYQSRSNFFVQPSILQYNNDLSTTNNTQFLTKHETSAILPTICANNELHDVSNYNHSYKKGSQFLSPVQEIFQSKVSEYQFQEMRYNSKSPQQIINKSAKQQHLSVSNDIQKKMSHLMKENEKLMNINEDLVNELETVRKRSGEKSVMEGDDSFLVTQLKREIKQLQISQQKQSALNQNQKQQITNLNNLQDNIDSRLQYENRELQIQNESLQQKAKQLEKDLQIVKFKFEKSCEETPGLQENMHLLGAQKVEWQNKLNIILDENERLNTILTERLMQADGINSIVFDLTNQVNKLKRNNQEEMIDYQNKSSDITRKLEAQLQIKNREIQTMKFQLDDNQAYQQHNVQDCKDRFKDLEETLISKNDMMSQMSSKLRNIDVKWRERCKVFQAQLKESYKIRFKQEYQNGAAHGNIQSIQQYEGTMNNMQTKLNISQQENEQLKAMLQESRDLQKHTNKHINEISIKCQQVWDEEKSNLMAQIQALRQQLKTNQNYMVEIKQKDTKSAHNVRAHTTQSSQSDLNTLESFGLQSKFNMLEQNKEVNQHILRKCADLMSRQF